MVSDRELIDLVIRLLNGHGDQQDIEQLHDWKQTSLDRNVNQQAKYIINIGEAEGIKIGDSLDTELLEEIRDLLLKQSITPDLDIDWQKMSQVMLEEYQRLTTNPLTAGEGVFHLSDRVYVPLGLVERKQKARRKEDVSPEKGSELYQETEITQRFENEEFLEQVLKLGQSPKSQGRRIAIIGELGAGKTTLLQQISQWITKQVEDAIVIWLSLADLRRQEIEIYLLERWLQAVAQRLGKAEATPQIKDTFVTQFQQGRVWLLLDGVDEMQVASVNPLAEISQQVRMGGLLSQAKIVLTCRVNLWDSNVNTLDTFDTYRTLEFSYPQQVEQFIGNWFCSLSSEEKQTGQNLCTAIKEQGKKRIRDLVKNPLRLTLLCFNWYLGNGKLPEIKGVLYEQFVDDFYEWKREQFTTTAKQRRELNEKLGKLAQEAIDKENIRFRLQEKFVCEYLGEPDNENSLFSLALQLGWLNKVGVDAENPKKEVYAFFHPSFQEYFAAKEFVENANYGNLVINIYKNTWREIFLLVTEMTNNADELMCLMKQNIDMLVADETEIQKLLTKVNTKSCSITNTSYKCGEIRAFYFALFLVIPLSFPRISQPTHHIIKFGSTFDDELGLDLQLAHACSDKPRPLALKRAIEKIESNSKYGELTYELKKLLNRVPEELDERKLWVKENGQVYTNQLQKIIYKYRKMKFVWLLNNEQKSLLEQYFEANKLLIICLNNNFTVSEKVRKDIEDTLLLPISEMQKRNIKDKSPKDN